MLALVSRPKAQLKRSVARALFFLVLLSSLRGEESPVAGGVATDGAAKPAAESGAAPSSPATSSAEVDLSAKTMALDIATSSFYELVAWARSLGLPEGGQASELRDRLYEHYGLKPPAAVESGRNITIEKAGSAEYFKMDSEEGSPIIRISGGVVLRLNDEKKGESHLLEADQIVYDKDHDALSAVGSVHYRREKGTSVEEFRGETLNVSLSDWSGIFLDGKLLRNASTPASGSSGTGSSSSARSFGFQADTMIKRNGDILVLDDAIVSSCDAEHPHYSVRAKRLWLLGSKEWAIANAVVSVGEIPILWLPFFYFPSEEPVFHPVFGSRTREGRFVQTTTYLIGQKPTKKTSSILSMVATDSGEAKELRGVYLRSVPGSKAKSDGASSLKLLADAYSSLGAAVGLVGAFPKAGPFQNLNFNLGLGMSRSISTTSFSTAYTPFFSEHGYEGIWNTQGILPFRFGASLSTTLKAGPLGLAISLPFYSDEYWDIDFNDRSEDMEWLKLSDSSTSTTSSSVSTRSAFTDTISLSSSYQPKFLSPWLSSIDLSRLSASMSWLAKSNDELLAGYRKDPDYSGAAYLLWGVDPARYFFYPSIFKPLDLSLALRGSLIPGSKQASSKTAAAASNGAGAALSLRSPWEEAAPSEEEKAGSPAATAASASAGLRLPERVPGFPAAGGSQSGALSLDWNVTPTAFIETKYLSDSASYYDSTARKSYSYTGWTGPTDISLDSYLYQLLSYKVTGSLTASLSYPSGLGSTSLGLSLSTQDQQRETVAADEIKKAYTSLLTSYKKTDWQYKQTKLASSFKTSFTPFANFFLLSPSSLSYSFEGFLYRYVYKSLASDGQPVYDEKPIAWDSESITTNSATLSLGIRTGAKTQTLGLTASYLPATEAYSGSLALAAGVDPFSASFSLSSRASRAIGSTATSSAFTFDPLSLGLVLSGPAELKLSDTFTYDIEKGYPKTNAATFAWGPFSASLNAGRSLSYYIDNGWQSKGSEEFRVTSFATAFKNTWKTDAASPLAASLSLDSSYTQSVLKFSDSVLAFNLGLSFKVTDSIDLSFSSSSQNASAWQYWPWLFASSLEGTGKTADEWAKNPLYDIAQGFYFWDSDARSASLFKLKSLSVKLVRYLHDWDMSFTLSATPKLDTTSSPYKYILNPVFQFLLTWRDMSDIKASFSRNSSGDYSF
jgi:hypothetical protein